VDFSMIMYSAELTATINELKGSFPNITEFPIHLGSDLTFISKSSNLKMPDFPNLTTIGNNVLFSGCLSLTSITFGNMDKLTTIGTNFCRGIRADCIDLQSMKNVKIIDKSFLRTIITKTIMLPSFSLLEDIGPYWLEDASIEDEDAGFNALLVFSRFSQDQYM
jgi:hypothetical protein